MSRIYIHVYDGDSVDYDPSDEAATIGSRKDMRSGGSREFRDGEELAAAVVIAELLHDCKHFDVRQDIS